MVKVECPRCGGSGILPQHRRIIGGTCFLCDGRGYVLRKVTPVVVSKWFTVFAKEIGGGSLRPVFTRKSRSAEILRRSAVVQLRAVKPGSRQWDPDTVVVRERSI
jgi:DnaJ-class molecular chaperone